MRVCTRQRDTSESNVDGVGQRVVVTELSDGLRAVDDGKSEMRVVRKELWVRGWGRC